MIGVVNTEGVPGLDFPEFTVAFEAAARYVNAQLGGFGGRPVRLEVCKAAGSPESSQACAQQLAAKHVDLVMLGIDVFVAYPTYAAAGIPVYGAVPVLPADYTADAVYLTAGNLVIMAATANAATNPAFLGARRVAVIANDTPVTISALASLQPALAKAGARATVVKGAENETDAGFTALMQQAADSHPDAIISLYGASGCLSLMRARKNLGVQAPVLSNVVCLNRKVTDVAGTAALDWYFAGATGRSETTDSKLMRSYVADVRGIEADDVDPNGFTGVGWLELLSAWQVADRLGGPVTGAGIIEGFRSGKGVLWGAPGPLTCGSVPAYSSVCTFVVPFARFGEAGPEPAFGGALISALELLPT